jgi:hypothetical protein
VKRQQQTGNHNADLEVASSQHFSAGLMLQELPVTLKNPRKDNAPTVGAGKSNKSIAQNQYSLSERKQRANAFAARVNSLKFYIGLIGAQAII